MAALNRMTFGLALAGLLLAAGTARADCNQPAAAPVLQVPLPGHPFSAIPSADGCTIFVSLTARPGHIAILRRDNGTVAVAQTVAVDGLPAGMALSPDGRLLAVARGAGVVLFNASALANGNAAQVASLGGSEHIGSVYAAFSPDSRLLVVANEGGSSLSLYDVSAEPRSLGKLAVGSTPVGLAFSADSRLLYSTSEVGPHGWPVKCHNEKEQYPEGLLTVFDVAKVTADPKAGMIAGVSAGCDPVRVALSPDGKAAYVTVRGDNAVKIFDTTRLAGDPSHSLTATVPVGISPVGVAVAGGHIFVTNSNRFGGGAEQSVSVLDATNLSAPAGTIPAGGFPRELKFTADGNTLLVTNFASGTLELVDVARAMPAK
jgi:DNA-binding beta-propeller fold protein YncE